MMSTYALRFRAMAIVVIALSGCATISETTDELLVETGLGRFKRFEPVDPGPWYGPLAEEYAGRVVFSSEYIPRDSDDDGTVIAEYRLGDPLAIRYWSADSPHNMLGTLEPAGFDPVVIYVATVGNATIELGRESLGLDNVRERVAATIGGEVLTVPVPHIVGIGSESVDLAVRRTFSDSVVSRLPAGPTIAEIEVFVATEFLEDDWSRTDERVALLARGSLPIVVTEASRTAYVAEFGSRLPAYRHREGVRLAQLIEELAISALEWQGGTILATAVWSPDWLQIRDEDTGVLTHEYVEAYFVAPRAGTADVCNAYLTRLQREVATNYHYLDFIFEIEMDFPCANAALPGI